MLFCNHRLTPPFPPSPLVPDHERNHRWASGPLEQKLEMLDLKKKGASEIANLAWCKLQQQVFCHRFVVMERIPRVIEFKPPPTGNPYLKHLWKVARPGSTLWIPKSRCLKFRQLSEATFYLSGLPLDITSGPILHGMNCDPKKDFNCPERASAWPLLMTLFNLWGVGCATGFQPLGDIVQITVTWLHKSVARLNWEGGQIFCLDLMERLGRNEMNKECWSSDITREWLGFKKWYQLPPICSKGPG